MVNNMNDNSENVKIFDKPDICEIKSTETKDNIILKGVESYYEISYYVKNFFDSTSFNKFVKAVEKLVRKSDEYSAYLGDLRSTVKLKNCAYLGNIDPDMVSIEFHHYPFTLYDIICLITEKMLKEKAKVSTFKVAAVCMDLHFNNLIGLIPLTVTVHELVHNGEIFINLKYVYGYYDKFIEMYKDYMYPEMIDTYNKLVELTDLDFIYSDKDILKY